MANKYTKTVVDIDKVVSLYESGMTQVEVAKHMGLTQKLIWHRLKESGIKCRVAKKRNQFGSNNSYWKGKKATYRAFHRRLDALKGKPKRCEACGTTDPKKTYDWANMSGRYDDPNDYKRLCRSCHWKRDKKYLNFTKSSI